MLTTAAKNKPKILFLLGLMLIATGLIFLSPIYGPVAKEEIRYQVSKTQKQPAEIKPVNSDFGIVIPKIGANEKVIANVDPFDPKQYQIQLTKGVAQAKGSAFPGENGNIFIFAHSAGDFLEANRYNAEFYLLDRLNEGDKVFLFYKNSKFTYLVTDRKIVGAGEVKYIQGDSQKKSLTLMTCWPAGTTLRRLIITAEMAYNN